MPATSVRDVTFEDVIVLKYALDFELRIMTEKSDVVVAILVGLNGQVLASCVPDDLASDMYRLLNLVRANIPYLRKEITIGRIEQSITRYEAGNVVVTRVGNGQLLISVLNKDASVTRNLPQIYTSAQILTHISNQKAITKSELAEYGEDVAEELAELTRRLYSELEAKGTVGEKKKNEEALAKFKAILDSIVGQAESDMIMIAKINQLGIRTKQVSPAQWRQLVSQIRRSVEAKAGRYYAELSENRLMDVIVKSEEMF